MVDPMADAMVDSMVDATVGLKRAMVGPRYALRTLVPKECPFGWAKGACCVVGKLTHSLTHCHEPTSVFLQQNHDNNLIDDNDMAGTNNNAVKGGTNA